MPLFHLAALAWGIYLARQCFPHPKARRAIAAGLLLGTSLAFFWWEFNL